MYRLKRTLLSLGFAILLLGVQNARAQDVLVALPDTSVLTTQASIPIWIDDISSHAVQGFFFSITYDSTHFSVLDVHEDGHLAQHFTMAVNTDNPGRLLVAGAKASPIAGRGALLTLDVKFKRNAESVLELEQFAFNEGTPLAAPQQGRISNRDAPTVTDDPSLGEHGFMVIGHYPNPFRTTATLIYSTEHPSEISLQVLDVTGREVIRHAPLPRPAGPNQTLMIDASNLSAGVYLYRLTAHSSDFTVSQTGLLTVVH